MYHYNAATALEELQEDALFAASRQITRHDPAHGTPPDERSASINNFRTI